MKSLVFGLAMALMLAVSSTANAAFLAAFTGTASAGGLGINYTVEDLGGGNFGYYYQLLGPVPNATMELAIDGNYSGTPLALIDRNIDTGTPGVNVVAGSTQQGNTAVSTATGIALQGFLVGTRPTEVLFAQSGTGPVMGNGTLTIGGQTFSFRAPVAAVPVPGALALVAVGLPFIGALRRRMSRS